MIECKFYTFIEEGKIKYCFSVIRDSFESSLEHLKNLDF